MNFKPLTTLDELKAAQDAGLRVEASWNATDSVDMPPSDEINSGGWLVISSPEIWMKNKSGQLRVEVRDEVTDMYGYPVPTQRYPDDAVAKLVEVARLVADRCTRRKRAAGNGYTFMPGAEEEYHQLVTALANLEPKS